MIQKYYVADIFSGVGGFSYGFEKHSGFEVVFANEIDKNIANAYTLNYPNVNMINCDINLLSENVIKTVLNGKKIDVLIGGPPCQSYSTIGKRQLDDRANLFVQYKRLLDILKPQIFIFENVSGILSMDKGNLITKIESEFNELGYHLVKKVLNAADYGVPQIRERVILVGMKEKNTFIFPKPTHGEDRMPYITLEQAIGDLPQIKGGEEATFYSKDIDNSFLEFVRKNNVILTEHLAPKNGQHLVKIMETLKEGEGRNDLPEELRPKKGFGNTYAKLWWNKPATTITRNFACPSSSRCIHPRDSRAMSIREGARLQSFPDDYIFYGPAGTKRLEIGNAVPPLLSVSLANAVYQTLSKK